MSKEFHIWFKNCSSVDTINTLYDVEQALNHELPEIHTYQAESVGTYLFDLGYRIFVHPLVGNTFELTLGNCANTDREIRIGHNLCKMLVNGVFDTDETLVTGLE